MLTEYTYQFPDTTKNNLTYLWFNLPETKEEKLLDIKPRKYEN